LKRDKLIKEISKLGAVFVRHGSKHDIYENSKTNKSTQVPRHPDVNEMVAKAIIKFFTS
jgi:predicted RNA binding protein YcfA (HicA-like mRNA interferase family)